MPVRMAASPKTANFAPMAELNTTPLIDVMLVLLVMFIITIPIATHSLDLPLPNGETTQVVNEDRNRLTLTAQDRLLWNDNQVDRTEAATLLNRAAALKPEPQLEVAPDPQASYSAAAETLNLVKASGASNIGLVNNEQFREFGKSAK